MSKHVLPQGIFANFFCLSGFNASNAELMIHVFSLCTPKDLGNAVRVNKAWKGWTEEDMVISSPDNQNYTVFINLVNRSGRNCSRDCLVVRLL